jgi:hypothetical protein
MRRGSLYQQYFSRNMLEMDSFWMFICLSSMELVMKGKGHRKMSSSASVYSMKQLQQALSQLDHFIYLTIFLAITILI